LCIEDEDRSARRERERERSELTVKQSPAPVVSLTGPTTLPGPSRSLVPPCRSTTTPSAPRVMMMPVSSRRLVSLSASSSASGPAARAAAAASSDASATRRSSASPALMTSQSSLTHSNAARSAFESIGLGLKRVTRPAALARSRVRRVSGSGISFWRRRCV